MLPQFLRFTLPALGALAIACPMSAHAASITFSHPNCASFSLVDAGGGNFTLTCNSGTTAPPPPAAGAPTGCAVTRAPSTGTVPATGGAVGAALYCSSTVTSYTWRKNGVGYTTGQGIGDTLPVNGGTAALTTTYDVIACNGAACTNPIVTTFVVAGGSGGGGAPAANNLCGNYSNVIFVDVPWGGQAIANSGGSAFAAGGVLVARFVVPAGAAYGDGSLGKIQVAEYGDPATYRQATLSQVACDFRGAPGPYGSPGPTDDAKGASASVPLAWRFGNTATAEFTVTGANAFYAQLVPGQLYFYNIRNFSQDLGNSVSCNGASCNAVVSINTP